MSRSVLVPGGNRGIGLANAEERLRTLHGDKGRLDIVTPATGGVQVQIVLPLRLAAPAPNVFA